MTQYVLNHCSLQLSVSTCASLSHPETTQELFNAAKVAQSFLLKIQDAH